MVGDNGGNREYGIGGVVTTPLKDESKFRGSLILKEGENGMYGMIGMSPGMQKVYETIEQVADLDVAVNVQGESGTGKELVAKAIHHYSRNIVT